MAGKYDYKALVWAELRDFSQMLHGLTKEDWEHPTLCEGWKVRHVVGHLALGYSTPIPQVLKVLATQYRFSLPKAAHVESTRFGEEHSPEQLLSIFDEWALRDRHIGIATLPPMSEHFLDHMIHHWDITVPLGRPRQPSEERLLAALEAMVQARGVSGLPPGRKMAAGLRFRATDVNWSAGEGPEVYGPASSIILALSGRPRGLEDLQGEGVATLRQRLGAPATATA